MNTFNHNFSETEREREREGGRRNRREKVRKAYQAIQGITAMHHVTKFQSTTERIYNSGPCVIIAYSIQYSNMLYRFVA